MRFSFLFAAIYGADQRQDIGELSTAWQERARAIAAAVPVNFLKTATSGDLFHEGWESSLYGDSLRLCPDQPFYSQTSFGHCTAFLISPQHLVTAGHCLIPAGEIVNQAHPYCEGFAFWLGYNDVTSHAPLGSQIQPENLVRCQRVLYAINNQVMRPDEGPLDFAILELTKPVTHIKPLDLQIQEPGLGASLATIGHPQGLPAKFSGWDFRRGEKAESTTLSSLLDTFAGNSGGPVFNQTGEVVGVLISGHQFDVVPAGSCQRLNRCAANGRQCEKNSKLPSQNLILRARVLLEALSLLNNPATV